MARRPLELKPGRYWFDLFPSDMSRWARWSAQETGAQRVRVLTTVDPATPGEFAWVLFEVLQPTSWTLPGAPSPAGPDVRSPQDTADYLVFPAPLWGTADERGGKGGVVRKAAPYAAAFVGGAVVALWLSKGDDE